MLVWYQLLNTLAGPGIRGFFPLSYQAGTCIGYFEKLSYQDKLVLVASPRLFLTGNMTGMELVEGGYHLEYLPD